MRILHALSQTELTGSEVYAFELSEHQAKAGHELVIVSDKLHKPFKGKSISMSLSSGAFTRIANILRLRKILQEEFIDVIHCHSRGACRHLFWASRGLGIPMVTTIHGRQHSSFSKRLFDIYGDIVIAICERIAEQLKLDFKMSEHKIEVLRNPVSITMPALNPVKPKVALIGRSSGPKGERLVALLKSQTERLKKENPRLEISLVLSGLSNKEREELEIQLGVDVVGSIPSLVPIFTSSTIIVASGRVAIEAIMAGRKVLALGEAEYCGEVTLGNIAPCLKSNFGDVGETQKLPFELIGSDILRLANPIAAADGSSMIDPELIARVKHEFNPARVSARIEELYKGARILKRAPWIPILMYHKVVREEIPSKHRIFVKVKTFAEHLDFFRRRGFSTLHFSELADFWHGRRPLREFPKKPLILTFDDGYKNNRANALPLLKQYGAKATIFALADPAVTFNSWDAAEGEPREDLMSIEELQELPRETIEIGSHGFRHERLTEKSDQEVLTELWESKHILKQELPDRPINVFAYAYGSVDPRLPRLAQQAEYDFAVNTDSGPVMWIKDRWSLFRVNIFPEDNWFSLWKKTSPWYRKYYFKKRGR